MKHLITLLILIPLTLFGQESPFQYFKSKDAVVYFEAIYKVDSLSATELKERLLTFIPTVKGVQDVHQNSDGLTAELKGYQFDYKSAGYSLMGAPIALIHPLSGFISVNIKEGKYKISITNIILVDDEKYKDIMPLFYRASLSDLLLKSNKKDWVTNKGKLNIGFKLEEGLYKSFKLNYNTSEW